MQNRPTAAELLDAVRQLLTDDLLPAVQDDGLRFKTRIAINVLAIVARELHDGDPLVDAEWNRLRALLPDEPIDPALSISEATLALNRRFADEIRHAPPDTDLIQIGGPAWEHVKQALHDQLRIAAPKFDTST